MVGVLPMPHLVIRQAGNGLKKHAVISGAVDGAGGADAIEMLPLEMVPVIPDRHAPGQLIVLVSMISGQITLHMATVSMGPLLNRSGRELF